MRPHTLMHRVQASTCRARTHSLLRLAALLVGGAVALQAHAAGNAAPPAASTAQPGPAATGSVNPANPGAATAPASESPPMTTSPAFDNTTQAAKGTGSAQNPDKRPVIQATRPTAVKPATAPSEPK